MFIEFPSSTTQGGKITLSLLNISSVHPSTESKNTTVIQMANGSYHYVSDHYERVIHQIRSQCK